MQLNAETCKAVIESLPNGVYVVDRERRIQLWSDGAQSISGYLRHEVVGRQCQDNLLMHCDMDHAALCGGECPVASAMHSGKPHDAHLFLRHKDGHRVPVRVRAVPLRDSNGAIVGAVEIFEISHLAPEPGPGGGDSAEIEEAPRQPAGVSSRETVEERLLAALDGFDERQAPFGVLLVGIDGLERFREFRGAEAVQEIQRVVGETLAVGLDGMVCRWPANRFFGIVEGAPERLADMGERIRRLSGLSAISWWGDRISVSVSIGGAQAREGDSVESLLARAVEAFAASISNGGNCVTIS